MNETMINEVNEEIEVNELGFTEDLPENEFEEAEVNTSGPSKGLIALGALGAAALIGGIVVGVKKHKKKKAEAEVEEEETEKPKKTKLKDKFKMKKKEVNDEPDDDEDVEEE